MNKIPMVELHDGLEERPVLGHVDAVKIGEDDAHADGRDEAGVAADRIAQGDDGDDGGDDRLGTEQPSQPEVAEEEPQHRNADGTGGEADPNTSDEAERAINDSVLVVGLEILEDHDGDDRADRVDGRSLETQDRGQPLAGPRGVEQRGHNRRARDDQDRTEHDRGLR